MDKKKVKHRMEHCAAIKQNQLLIHLIMDESQRHPECKKPTSVDYIDVGGEYTYGGIACRNLGDSWNGLHPHCGGHMELSG